MAIEIKTQHVTIGDLSKPAGNIPTGVWKLRAVSGIKVEQFEHAPREGEPFEAQKYSVTLEPLKPTSSVDPEALTELDPLTGKPAYDGKRIFLSFKTPFRNDMQSLGAMLSAMGFGDKDSFDEVVSSGATKGKVVFGEVFNRNYTHNGQERTEQRVKSWSSAATADAMAI